ncbi:hypothetical protein M8C21_007211 [Ambrosia artemisiifolia]|uniref:Uncharacterized protein n=1 Tax=Ambrosia artemisiifolia TaxID=4212 RepID=A0AAD5BL91_AMBAR|nr:hypothetical protein M8C21_007211 [Ambrosia artemisiifolia]
MPSVSRILNNPYMAKVFSSIRVRKRQDQRLQFDFLLSWNRFHPWRPNLNFFSIKSSFLLSFKVSKEFKLGPQGSDSLVEEGILTGSGGCCDV